MKDYGKIANELAGIANAQNMSLKVLARETKRDSRLVKVLTVTAIVYLPANLIAVKQTFPASKFVSKSSYLIESRRFFHLVLSGHPIRTFTGLRFT